ncbi:DUF3842 family protein [Caproiciproducens sp.]|uniref:DUF3842 family protein n=1 Tax=Caproiciproducens sp. TaxID=1954376 RepID=UPI0028A02AAE|nr:DUF3842 family protein [Caproiciproducens sp.]
MSKKEMLISIIDGQGGGIGKCLIAKLRESVLKKSNVKICALGTNSVATNCMMKAGADVGATGQNAIVQTVKQSDLILGPLAIIAANSMMGELTPAMAFAISSSSAQKILIPLNRCKITIASEVISTTNSYIDSCVGLVMQYVDEFAMEQ